MCTLFCLIIARSILNENTLFFDWLPLLKKKILKLIFYFFEFSYYKGSYFQACSQCSACCEYFSLLKLAIYM